jgi:hypothetical protein
MALKPKYLSHDILVCVTNYDFSEQADTLKRRFSRKLPTILIDSSSPVPPTLADVVIPNDYYPGLWNTAVRTAGENRFKWMMFIASDVEIDDVNAVCRRAVEAIQIPRVGVWTPSLRSGSRTDFNACINKDSQSVRECGLIEGFFFLTRVDLLACLYPIEKVNRYGWGADVALSFYAYADGLGSFVDDRVTIYHPASRADHQIDTDVALRSSRAYFGLEICTWGGHIKTIFK